MTRLGRLLRVFRNHEDRTLRELAVEIGVSLATMQRLEMGKDMDSRTMIKLLVWLFGEGTETK